MRTQGLNAYQRMIFVCTLLAVALFVGASATFIQAQEEKFPSRTVEVLNPYYPGGIVDVGTRILADFISTELKVPIIIKNQAGASGLTGSAAFLNARPDGYSMLAVSAGAVISAPQFSKNPPFDVRKDLLPVGYIADTPIAMSVGKASPFKSFDDFVQFAKSNPGKLIGAQSALGSETHMMYVAILKDAKIETKMIPYPGIGQMMAGLMGGHVDWCTQTLPSALQYVRGDELRILLLTRRSQLLPDVPAGVDKGMPTVSSCTMWLGFFVHPKTPKFAYERLVSAVEAVSKNPEVAKKLATVGLEVRYKSPREFSDIIKDDWEYVSRFIKETGMEVK